MNGEESRWFPVKFSGFFPPRVLGISPGRLEFMEALEWGSPGSVQGLPDRRNQSTDMRIRGTEEHRAPHIRTEKLGRRANSQSERR